VRAPAVFTDEERQYAPFVAGAICIALVVGFPLGLSLALARTQDGTLDGHWPALAQVHGHLQLAGWFGLFVTGMGLRLVPRFTGARLRSAWPAPVTFALIASGLALRGVSQPWMDSAPYGLLAVLSAVLQFAGAVIFAGVILRCLVRGRRDDFGYTPYFSTGALWLVVAMAMNLWFVTDAVDGNAVTLPALRSLALTYTLLYGFITMFILGVSIRTAPVFFGRPPVPKLPGRGVWLMATAGTVMYVAGAFWRGEEASDSARWLYNGGLLVSALGLAGAVLALGILRGAPHRLRASAQRSMLFVRAGYGWLLAGAVLQAYYALKAAADDRLVLYYETDAVRHLLALGFATTVLFGMALLVLPRLAMRRGTGRSVAAVIATLLLLAQGAAVARGAGSLLVNEAHFDEGFWAMSAGGITGLLAVLLFTAYLLQHPGQIEIPLPPQTNAPEG
jgi:hypothetical protein